MVSNLDRFRTDLDRLIEQGDGLELAMQYECMPERLTEALGADKAAVLKSLPHFSESYEVWYSEAKTLIRQLLPERFDDFVRRYEKPKPRKDITFENYRIEDYLQGLLVRRGVDREVVVDGSAAIPHFRQQVAMLKAVRRRFESSLFDIRQLVQADLFDSGVDAAEELARAGYHRAAGALGGVVLERHLGQVCSNHGLSFRKRKLTLADFNDALKNNQVIDVATWRFVQHLGDIRNLCSHSKAAEPSREQVDDLLVGVRKTIKTLF